MLSHPNYMTLRNDYSIIILNKMASKCRLYALSLSLSLSLDLSLYIKKRKEQKI